MEAQRHLKEDSVMAKPEVFVAPVGDKFLIYAPLHQFAALVNELAVREIQHGLQTDSYPVHPTLRPILHQLQTSSPAPIARTGPLAPLFLGFIPTRGCNMACRYCDFAAPKQTSPVMEPSMAQAALDAYFRLLQEMELSQANIHFFGGEPFFAPQLVGFVVEYAKMRANASQLEVHFEVTTNGLYSPQRCRWIANQFDTVVLSLDGPADIHDLHRPAINGRSTHAIIARSAHLFSEGACELVIRVCVTQNSVTRLPEIAEWISQHSHPSTVCFESLTSSVLSEASALKLPDPWLFARQFETAVSILATHGIEAISSTADIGQCRATFCPVGKDALILSPDGALDACYLLESEWRNAGLNMRLGWLDVVTQQFRLDSAVIQQVRQLTVQQKTLCTHCLCRYHCAGGCPVNHPTAVPPGQYDALCIQTRLMTLAALLRRLGQSALVQTWLADPQALETAVFQPNDRLEAYL